MQRNDRLIATRFPEDLINRLDEVAKQEDRTRSQVLRKIARRYVATFRPLNKENDFMNVDPFAVS
jgi:metal-responsive CopG/Arc/MetJ family transcriptional regulator